MMQEYRQELNALELKHPRVLKHRRKVIWSAVIKTIIIQIMAISVSLVTLIDRREILLIAIVFGVTVLPWIFVKPGKIIRQHFVGQITGIEYVQRRVNVGGVASTLYTSMQDAIFIKCIVKDNAGKTHSFEVPAKYDAVYKIGDRVISTSGISYPVNLTPHEQIVCVRCGSMIPLGKEFCMTCGYQT